MDELRKKVFIYLLLL